MKETVILNNRFLILFEFFLGKSTVSLRTKWNDENILYIVFIRKILIFPIIFISSDRIKPILVT